MDLAHFRFVYLSLEDHLIHIGDGRNGRPLIEGIALDYLVSNLHGDL